MTVSLDACLTNKVKKRHLVQQMAGKNYIIYIYTTSFWPIGKSDYLCISGYAQMQCLMSRVGPNVISDYQTNRLSIINSMSFPSQSFTFYDIIMLPLYRECDLLYLVLHKLAVHGVESARELAGLRPHRLQFGLVRIDLIMNTLQHNQGWVG